MAVKYLKRSPSSSPRREEFEGDGKDCLRNGEETIPCEEVDKFEVQETDRVEFLRNGGRLGEKKIRSGVLTATVEGHAGICSREWS